jgi:predicted phage-related endonuclease
MVAFPDAPPAGIERIPIESREQWLALRKQDVTASRIGALFSCHPYATALRLYMEQAGLEFPEQNENPVMRRGRLLEPVVAQDVAEQHPEWHITKNSHYYRNPKLRLGATPDFLIEGDSRGLGVLQTKTSGPAEFARDWANGTEIPFWIILQTLTEAMLTGATWAVIAVMPVDAYKLASTILDVPRHPATEQRIRTAVTQFWDDVAHGREPAPDYGKDADLIKLLAPRAIPDKSIDLSTDNEFPEILAQREQLKEKIKLCQARVEEIDTEIRFRMRDAERIDGINGWSIRWKNEPRAAYTVPANPDNRPLRIKHTG